MLVFKNSRCIGTTVKIIKELIMSEYKGIESLIVVPTHASRKYMLDRAVELKMDLNVLYPRIVVADDNLECLQGRTLNYLIVDEGVPDRTLLKMISYCDIRSIPYYFVVADYKK